MLFESPPSLQHALDEFGHALRHYFATKQELREMQEDKDQEISQCDQQLLDDLLESSERTTKRLERLARKHVPTSD